jgi:hypothetical protein
VLSYEALGDDVSAEDIVAAILSRVPVPEVVLRDVRVFDDSERLWKPPAPT